MRGIVLESAQHAESDFADRLEDLVKGIRATREALISLTPYAPNQEAAWLEMMSRREVAENLGEVMLLSAKNAGWANTIVQQILSTLGQRVLDADAQEVVRHVVAGQVRAEMACECGECDPCMCKKGRGATETTKRLEDMLLPRSGPRIVGPNGRALH